MSLFGIFDWISPTIQSAQDGDSMLLTPGEMNYLKSKGVKVYTSSAFQVDREDVYMVKVSDAKKARKLLGK